MEIQEIIKVKQLPEIVEQLEKISSVVKKEVKSVLEMECSDDTVKEVKKKRADLNKQFKALEERRKYVKNEILAKYNEFEEVYNDKISSLYKNADEELKTKIDNVENELKKEKEDEIREFAHEHIVDKHLENILDYEKFNINVTLSKSVKSIKEEILSFIERVEKEMKNIELEEYKDEILVEYKKTLDYMGARLTVIERHKEIEQVKQQQAVVQEIVQEEKQAVQVVVEEITTPVEVTESDEIQEVTFTVYAPISKLRSLKEFMLKEGIRYE